MSGINADQLVTELGNYKRLYHEQIRQMIYQKTITAQYMKSIPKVNGDFPAPHSITGRVIQGFKSVWNELGETEFKANKLVNYRQKINYGYIPDDILGTWLGYLYQENLTREQMPISKYIMTVELPKAIARDQEYLLGKGVYDENDLETFGKSMDGIKELIRKGKASGDKPMYKIPVPALNKTNAVDVIEGFEEKFPLSLFDMVDDLPIFMGTDAAYYYKVDARNTFGAMTNFDQAFLTTSNITGRKIIGLPSLNGTGVLFATPLDNFLRLIDIFNKPTLTDIQKADYKVKLFFDWWDGPSFWINQLVLVADTVGSGSGLATDNDLYFG